MVARQKSGNIQEMQKKKSERSRTKGLTHSSIYNSKVRNCQGKSDKKGDVFPSLIFLLLFLILFILSRTLSIADWG